MSRRDPPRPAERRPADPGRTGRCDRWPQCAPAATWPACRGPRPGRRACRSASRHCAEKASCSTRISADLKQIKGKRVKTVRALSTEQRAAYRKMEPEGKDIFRLLPKMILPLELGFPLVGWNERYRKILAGWIR